MEDDDKVSLAEQLSPSNPLEEYKTHVQKETGRIVEMLTFMQNKYPYLREELSEPLKKCAELGEGLRERKEGTWEDWDVELHNQFMPSLPEPFFPSQQHL